MLELSFIPINYVSGSGGSMFTQLHAMLLGADECD